MKNLIGSKDFYKRVLFVAVPIMIQNGITNFVGMLDNIMVGQIGTNQMSGVAIVNQLIFIFNLCIFGGISGAGIFTAQYYGSNNDEGIRYTFRYKIILVLIIALCALGIFSFYGDNLISLYLNGESAGNDAAQTLFYAKQYLLVMMLDFIPFAITNAYAGTLRETEETILPMKAGIAAVFVNLIFNYILIYGKFGAPALGVTGAAIATVISRFVELSIIVIWTHTHTAKNRFIVGAYKSMRIPLPLAKMIFLKGTPLLINETLWAGGQAMLTQTYSFLGLNVVAAMNISTTLSNVFNIIMIALGNSIAIIIGKELGARSETVKSDAYKLIFFSVISCVVTGALMVVFAPLFPSIYNTTSEVKALATSFIVVAACCMPMYSFENASYFIIRSGGKTIITFLFDSCFLLVAIIPVAFVLVHFTGLSIVAIYALVQLVDILKCTIGFILVRSGMWINNLALGTD